DRPGSLRNPADHPHPCAPGSYRICACTPGPYGLYDRRTPAGRPGDRAPGSDAPQASGPRDTADGQRRSSGRQAAGGGSGYRLWKRPRARCTFHPGAHAGLHLPFPGDTVQAPGRAPIYTDPVALVRSLRRFKAIPGIRHYLPSHDAPAQGEETYRRLDESLAYIRCIHGIIRNAVAETPGTPDSLVLAGRLSSELGLPAGPGPHAAFIARTIEADLSAQGLDELLGE